MTEEELAEGPYQNTINFDNTTGAFSYTQGYNNYEYVYSTGTTYILSQLYEAEIDFDLEIVSGSGEERYRNNEGSLGVDEYNCDLMWDLSVVENTGIDCTDCDFSFVVTATTQSNSDIIDDGSCDFDDNTFGYGINTNYPGYEGTAVMMYGSGSADGNNVNIEEWGGWFINMTEEELAEGPYQNTINFDITTGAFSYTQGYNNYEYVYMSAE